MKPGFSTFLVGTIMAGLFASTQAAAPPRMADSLAVDAAGTGTAEVQCSPGTAAGADGGCVSDGSETSRSDPFKGTNVAKIKQKEKEKAAQGKSAPTQGGDGTGTMVGADEHAINTKGTGTGGKAAPPRDAASGQATGKRQAVAGGNDVLETTDADGDGAGDVSTSPSNTPGGPIKGVSVKSGKGGPTETGKAASDEYCCPGRCCPPGSAEAAQAEVQPQTYKATQGKTGKTK